MLRSIKHVPITMYIQSKKALRNYLHLQQKFAATHITRVLTRKTESNNPIKLIAQIKKIFFSSFCQF